MITPVWTTEADVPPILPDTAYWQSLLLEDDPDPEFRTYGHLFAARRLVTDTQMRRIYSRYGGGADVFLTTPEERHLTRERHADWLSSSPSRL